MIYRMKLADSVDEMTFDLLEVPIEDNDIEGATDNTTIDGNIFTDYLWLKKQFVQKWSLMCKDDYTQLRGFYTRQWENAEAPTYTLFAGENRSETLTASGSAFQIQNGTQYGAPLTLTEIDGNATQNGTPTPSAPVAVQTTTGENVVKITGKNLIYLVPNTQRLNGITPTYNATTGEIHFQGTSTNSTGANGWSNCGAPTKLSMPAGTYTLSRNTPSPNYTTAIRTYHPDRTYTNFFITEGNTSITATLSKDIVEFYIFAESLPTTAIDDTFKLQFELGSTATAYEPYQGQSYTINLGSIELAKIGNYQDRIYKDGEKWYVEKQVGKVVLNGSENWDAPSTSVRTYYQMNFSGAIATTGFSATEALCDHFTPRGRWYVLNNNDLSIALSDIVISISYDAITSLADWKSWLSTHPTTVYYALATPTTTEITDSTLLAQLNFIANLYGGTNNIMLVGTGAQGEIGVEYTITYVKEQTIIPETTVRLTLTDGGVINTCECRQNVQLTMRETVQ